ncbi:MAG: integrase arm-type DNA-binding domain-containing protein [Xanthomonadaceae bacterium]|nr:integrase arm-type DNA-binding domain-containing protein [Xanthomonadaceae bacterium]MDP2186925.1 integrase arm-type DNA-binding domain-containing protein [Xanthomonadales bacterium]MDZ4117371.1 integrase arm-type DNA-binding domain-containing protein [Xanthomonadaceae bacterium]MDZ4377815.1 integrase arm-type DNA-binding domain-containing protein [Xanthomonadaceae bacterium]
MLTDTAARKAKPKAKPYKLTDAATLYLEVMPTGAKYWRMQYRHAGKPKRLALGVYPEVSLADARVKRDAARAIIREGRDPAAERKVAKARRALDAGNTFGAIAAEWLSKQAATMSDATMRKAQWMMALSQPLNALPLSSVTALDVLAVLRKIEAAGNNETAHRVKQRIGQVFRYAIATGRADRDPSADLRGALAPPVRKSRAAVTDPAQVADLLRAIAGYQGQFATCCALKLSPLVFVRPGELRRAEWTEFDLDAAEWRIPAHKMKMREAHTVPLAPQAVAILRDLHPLTGGWRYCFPSLRTADRPMSENTINAALRRLGFDKETMTGHGFRAMASTRLNEMGWAPDVIERQLAHAERNKVRAAYNRAQHMAERRKMMAAWADYLDILRDGAANVVAIRSKA